MIFGLTYRISLLFPAHELEFESLGVNFLSVLLSVVFGFLIVIEECSFDFFKIAVLLF